MAIELKVGEVYGQLTVIGYEGKRKQIRFWICRCTCGVEKGISGYELRSGGTKSCGCLRIEFGKTHGLHKHPIRGSYYAARDRCTNKSVPNYKDYGGRGIEFRLGTFEEFIKRMLPTWVEGLSLDRKDNNGHYEYGNIRWATKAEQCSNTRRNRVITFQGRTMILTDWAREFGIEAKSMEWRINNWGIEKALTTEVNKSNQPKHRRNKQ